MKIDSILKIDILQSLNFEKQEKVKGKYLVDQK